MVTWAKLTQGNSRGTCCWITHNLTIKFIKKFIHINLTNIKMRRIKWMPGCSTR